MDAPKTKIYGLLAEFATPTEIVDAANHAREAGYTAMESYSPFPVMDLHEAVGFKRTILPTLAFLGGLTGSGFHPDTAHPTPLRTRAPSA